MVSLCFLTHVIILFLQPPAENNSLLDGGNDIREWLDTDEGEKFRQSEKQQEEGGEEEEEEELQEEDDYSQDDETVMMVASSATSTSHSCKNCVD